MIASQLQLITQLGAILLGVTVALTGFSRQGEEEDKTLHYSRKRLRTAILVALAGFVVTSTVTFTPKGYDGVVLDLGAGILEQELATGVNLVVPIVQHVSNVNVQTQIYRHNNPDVWQHTADTQEIRVPVAINWRTGNASFVSENISGGPLTIIEPALLRALRTAIGSYSLEQIAPKQTEISERIFNEIAPQLALHGIIIEYVAIEDTIPKAGILTAIEEERIAERQKLTAEHQRDIAATRADEIRNAAAGEADAMITVANAERQRQEMLGMTAEEYVLFVKWNGAYPQVVAGDSGLILNIPNSAPAVAQPSTLPTVPAEE
jgi:regulator of protease activity HflC (stomatin/prohibitin superfamily)